VRTTHAAARIRNFTLWDSHKGLHFKNQKAAPRESDRLFVVRVIDFLGCIKAYVQAFSLHIQTYLPNMFGVRDFVVLGCRIAVLAFDVFETAIQPLSEKTGIALLCDGKALRTTRRFVVVLIVCVFVTDVG